MKSISENNNVTYDVSKMKLHLELEQQDGCINGNVLKERLKDKGLSAKVLDYLLEHPELIPEEWKEKCVFFWGTIYRYTDDRLYVRYLCWFGSQWGWSCRWLYNAFGDCDPAVVCDSKKQELIAKAEELKHKADELLEQANQM